MMSTRFIVTVFALSACDVGTFGAAGGGGGDDIDPTVCADRATATSTPPIPAFHNHTAPQVAGNMTNQGLGCIAASCHLGASLGVGAPEYQFAGTLYSDAALTTPSIGAHIRVKDASGKVIEAITDMFGNFSFPVGSSANAFPGQTSAAACPSAGGMTGGVSAMVSPIVAGGGNCNSGNTCHGAPLVGSMTALFLQSP
jgi:hypothetical protein